MNDPSATDRLREFSELTAELSELVRKWGPLTEAERAQQLDHFVRWHKDIANRMARHANPGNE